MFYMLHIVRASPGIPTRTSIPISPIDGRVGCSHFQLCCSAAVLWSLIWWGQKIRYLVAPEVLGPKGLWGLTWAPQDRALGGRAVRVSGQPGPGTSAFPGSTNEQPESCLHSPVALQRISRSEKKVVVVGPTRSGNTQRVPTYLQFISA